MKTIIRSNINISKLNQFFFAGRSTLTFRNNEKGTHITVRVKQLKDRKDRKTLLPIFYVFVSLVGDSEYGFRFGGTIFKDSLHLKLGRDVEAGGQLHKVMEFIMGALANPESLKKRVSLLHEGKCCRCSRQLTHPESINTGFGPECLGIVLSQANLTPSDLFEKIGGE